MVAWFYWVVLAIAAIYAYTKIPKPQNSPPPDLDQLEFPTAKEGQSIPVLFGRRKIKSPNVVWWGDVRSVPIKKKSGKK